MERVNQILRTGRVRGALVIALVLTVIIALLLISMLVVIKQEKPQVSSHNEVSLDAMRPMMAVARLERAGQEDARFANLLFHPETEAAPQRNFSADYQRYQELTQEQSQVAAAQGAKTPSAQEQAAAALAQNRAQALLSALTASATVESAPPQRGPTSPQSTAPQVNGALSDSAAQNLTPNLVKWQNALAQQGAMAEDSTPSHTLSAYEQLQGSATLLPNKVETVASPYLLRQGVLIPCVLLSGINSDLPGQVQAQVTSDVYDTPLGRHVLIPQGSKIIGQYASAPLMGQERLMLGFNRIIFPDGKALSLGAMPGASRDGMAGFAAEVDNHMWRLFSNAVLLGGVTAGISLAVDSDQYDDEGNLTLNGALSQGLGQSLGRVITSVIERNLAILPTLTVAPGFLFNVTLTQDIYFDEAYHGFDYAHSPDFGA